MKSIFALLITVGVVAGSASAHCGACGTGKTHDHTSKASMKQTHGTILETAKAAGSFKTLLAAVEVAGLSDALTGEGPYTVFAPTDDAFAALPEGALEALLKDKKKLTSILTYHVVEGAVKSDAVIGIDKAETLNGQSINIKVVEETVMIDNANVVKTDIVCTNGVIHVIDAVILPDVDES